MKKLVMLASTFLLLSPQVALADAYVGGKVGYSWSDASCPAGGDCSDDDAAGGIYGGYNFSEWFALEAGYDYLGDFKTDTTSVQLDDSMTAFTIAPKLNFSVGDFILFGKVGAAFVDYDDVNDTNLLTAIGTEYGFSDNLFGRLEYQRINNIMDGAADNLDVDSLFFGLTYKFGASEPEPAPVVVEEVMVVEEPVVAEVVEPAPEIKLFKEYGVELFDTDSYELAANSEQYFDWLVGIMKKYPQAEAKIVGHTDSRGSEAYNQTLSQNRAQSVADYLYTQGIEESRITVHGAGETEPKASNDTAEGRMENRRVEVIIDEIEVTE